MAVEVFVHKMTEHMETARILRWLAVEGETVVAGQAILEVETDKAVAELESPAGGVIKGIRAGAEAGAEVKVGETLAFIAGADEAVPVLPPIVTVGVEPDLPRQGASHAASPASPNLRATPVARRVARELGVDLARVKGTGRDGAVREEDVRAFAAEAERPEPNLSTGEAAAASAALLPGEWLELSLVQRLTGTRMQASVQTAPQLVLSVDVDASGILELKESPRWARQDGEAAGVSITSVFVKAVALTLKAHPRLNASYVDGRVRLHAPANIGVAVGTEQGLFVPVVFAADQKSLPEIDREIREFQEKAKRLRFSERDLADGTFTITNLGMYGVDRFDAIINPPQSAILAVGRVRELPVWLPGEGPAGRPMITLALTIDHRVLDGMHGARFLEGLKAALEHPEALAK